jgi:hypothetical protein
MGNYLNIKKKDGERRDQGCRDCCECQQEFS